MVEIVPATENHVRTIYGSPMPVTVTALAAVDGDKALMLAAIYPDAGRMLLTFKVSQETRQNMPKYARTILRGARAMLALATRTALPVQTVLDHRYPKAAVLLEHIGFRHLEKDTYQWKA